MGLGAWRLTFSIRIKWLDLRMRICSPVALAVLIGIGIGHVRCDAAPQDTNPGRDNVIRSTVREVLLDMVVRNAHGHLVTDLKPTDVTVYENGVRQNVRVSLPRYASYR